MANLAFITKIQSSKPIGSEHIVSATYTDPETGEVSEGDSHIDANPDAPKKDSDRETPEYGFKTSEGRMVNRKQAYDIAKKANQLKSPNPKRILHTTNIKYKKTK